MKKCFLIFLFFSCFALISLPFLAHSAIKLEYPLPGLSSCGDPITPGCYIRALYIWALSIVGATAVASIAYGGIRYMVGDVKNGKDIITSALLGMLVLLGAWLILYTINPDLATFKEPTEMQDVPPPSWQNASSTNSTVSSCSDPQQLAQQNNEPYPAKNAPETDALLNCVKTKLSGQNLGEISTYDKSHDICNYSRGKTTCGSCSHSASSCHYGGPSGTQGSLAIDFGNETIGNQIIQAVNQCGGAKSARCETASGTTVACNNQSANHVHVSLSSCSGS